MHKELKEEHQRLKEELADSGTMQKLVEVQEKMQIETERHRATEAKLCEALEKVQKEQESKLALYEEKLAAQNQLTEVEKQTEAMRVQLREYESTVKSEREKTTRVQEFQIELQKFAGKLSNEFSFLHRSSARWYVQICFWDMRHLQRVNCCQKCDQRDSCRCLLVKGQVLRRCLQRGAVMALRKC